MLKKFLIFFLLAVFLLSPLVGVAQFKLQQTYPSVGGSQLSQDVAASKSIPSLVKYLFNLAVWICILVAVLVLIIGGIQYVSSTGDVSKMSGAKTRIYSSLLGLTILIGAWFVLHTMNPSLVIPKITYIPIKQGIILFTEQGLKDFAIAKDESIINDLIQRGDAFRLNYDLPDLTKEFGELVGYNSKTQITDPITELNFENFKLYAIGFWGARDSQSIVAFYPQKNYLPSTKPDYFSTIGAVTKEGKICTGMGTGQTNCYSMPPDNNPNIKGFQFVKITSGIKDFIEYFNVYKFVEDTSSPPNKTINPVLVYSDQRQAYLKNNPFKISDISMGHPPMSLKIIRNGPGVYLADDKGNERYFDASAKNFKDPSINFNQLATKIKIVNDIPERKYTDANGKEQIIPPEFHDFLAILHQGDNFSGYLKIYFEARKYKRDPTTKTYVVAETNEKAKGKFIPAYTDGGNPGKRDPALDDNLFFKDSGFEFLYKQGVYGINEFGHLPALPAPPPALAKNTEDIKDVVDSAVAADLDKETIYGQIISSVSSLQLFELAEDQTTCQEVRICTEKQGRGYCIAYVAKDATKKEEPMVVFYPMPVYIPVNIPCPSMWLSSGCKKPIFNLLGANKEIDFDNHIKSIVITGKCAVFLAQNSLDYVVKSMWVGGVGPGARSEVFTQSDYDLEDNEIGLCGSVGVFNRQIGRECASAIAVYPIK